MNTQPIHAYDRLHRVRLAATYGLLSKIGSLAVTVVSIPLALESLGPERFGIWVTITTFFTLTSVLDGGVANAVINLIADHNASRNDRGLCCVLSSAYALLICLATIGFVCTASLCWIIDWSWAISLPPEIQSSEIYNATLLTAALYFLNMPLGLVAKIRQALQESHTNALFDLLSQFIIVSGTVVCSYYIRTLEGFLMAFALGPLLASLANTVAMRRRNDIALRPKINQVSINECVAILTRGAKFWGLQVCAAASFQSDALIVSHIAGPSAAGELGIVNRFFMVVLSLTNFVTTPLWPAFRDAIIRGETAWVRTIFLRTLLVSLSLSLLVTTPALIGYKTLFSLWAGNSITPDFSLVLAVYVWTNMLVAGNVITALLNGIDALRLQLIVGTLMALMNVPLSILATLWLGTKGVVIGSIISYGLCVLVPYCYLIPKIIRSK